jgi:RHS repeat-associated protein
VWRWDQAEPFGNNPADEDPDGNSVAFDLPLRLPGQRYDKETGLAYNMARDYASETGRYIQSDPIGLDGGLNTYAYVRGNALSYVDPEGLASSCPTPTVLCDGKGGFEICLGPRKGKCDEACTRAHENQHIADLMKTYPNKCRNRPKGDTLKFAKTDPFPRKTECNAYRVGLKCRQDLLIREPCCKDEIMKGIERDERQIQTFCR